jgi:hypothetical protein
MPSGPQSRPTDYGAQPVQPEQPSEYTPGEVAEPYRAQNPADTDWLTMTTPDPAFFLKDSNRE